MSLPVSQYEALLAEVRGLRRKAQRVQQLATPLLSTNTSTTSGINEHSLSNVAPTSSFLNYKMDSLNIQLSTDLDHGDCTLNNQVIESDTICSEDESGGALSAQMSVSSEPISHESRAMSMLYHGTWPVERTMWNSDPISLVPTTSSCNRTDMISVMSFASSSGGAPLDRVLCSPNRSRRSSQQLEAKVDMVYSLLSMLGGQEHADTGETLLALSTNPESCLAMRQSGCIPLLVQLVQSDKNCETQKKAAQALHNLVHSNPDEKLKKRETRVLKLLEEIRAYSEYLLNKSGSEALVKTEDEDAHPVQAIANLMKYSFDEGNRHAICQLGGIHTIANLVENEHSVHGSLSNEENCILLRRYSCMALTNLTFGDSGNKALLCLCKDFMCALVVQLQSPCDELRQVTASVLRNLSWRADATSKDILKQVGAVTGLMKAAMIHNKENTLKSVLSALWNLSAHCTENKSEICTVEDALSFLVKMLLYKSPSKSLTIIENAGGVLRNISSQIAIRDDYRQNLRDHNCLQILLEQLKSPSLTVVSNACGTLWNLSAKNRTDQDLLWQLGAPAMLRSLNHSKHKMIAMGSSAALKNLLASRQSHNLLPQMDATAKAMDLPTLPTLSARKQKAIIQELEQSLTETFDNIEKDASPFKAYSNETFSSENVDSIQTGSSNSFLKKSLQKHSDRHENNSYSTIDDVSNAFTNLSIVEPVTNYQNKAAHSRGYGSSSLPYAKSSASYLPLSNCSKCSYEEESDIAEEPVDYSRKYIIKTQTTSDFKTTSPNESFGIYTETDLDQPTDYSLRYAEDDSESEEICNKEKADFVQDTIKTYCTEDTPYETPFNYSTATSMSDLRDTGLDTEKEIIDNDQLTKTDMGKNRTLAQLDEKDHCSVEDISEIDNKPKGANKQIKSQFSSGLASPEKPINYAEEGTPGYFSRVSSFESLNSIPAGSTETNYKKLNLCQPVDEISQEESRKPHAVLPEGKVVKFEHVVNYAEETPLMFSRSSSLASLDSIEQHSIHDDHESVISDFSRLTSGLVSPSELPDSPTQTVPPSPRQPTSRNVVKNYRRSPADGESPPEPANTQKKSVFEDNVTGFKEESTPIQFSTATSLSSLTIDEEPIDLTSKIKDKSEFACILEQEETMKVNTENADDIQTMSESEGEDDILAACISDGMLKNRLHEKGPRNKLLSPSTSDQRSFSSQNLKNTPESVTRTDIHLDSIHNYCTEDTPALLSHSGLNSNLNLLTATSSLKKEEKNYLSDDSSNLSGDNDNILEECIQAAMPKAKILRKLDVRSRQPSSLPIRNVQPVKNENIKRNIGQPLSMYYGARDEIETYAVENSPCHISFHSSLSDLTVDDGTTGKLRPSNSSTPSKISKSGDIASTQNVTAGSSLLPMEPGLSLSRRDSFSSISGDSVGSLENEQGLLEQCISVGMPKSKQSPIVSTIPIKQFNTNKSQSNVLWEQQKKYNSYLENKLTNSKNVDVTSVAKNTITKNQIKPILVAGVESIESEETNWNHSLMHIDTSIELTKNGFDEANISNPKNTSFEDSSLADENENELENGNTESEKKPFDNRMLDPDAMIESLDRFTAELVLQAEAAHSIKDCRKFSSSITEGDTWNDTSPNDITFPSISGSAPNVITFKSDSDEIFGDREDSSNGLFNNMDAVDGVNDPNSNDFSSINTSTMTESTLIAVEATKMVSVFKNEVDLSNSLTSTHSLELDQVQPPSQLNSLTSSMNGLEFQLTRGSPKRISRKKSLQSGLLARRAVSNSLNQTSSMESLSNLDYIDPPSAMAEVFDVDLESSITSLTSLKSEIVDFTERSRQPNPIFNVKQPVNILHLFSNNSYTDLDNINPPSIFNEISDMCNSLADVKTEAICSETDYFEDCNTHFLEDTVVQTEDDVTQFSDAQSITPVLSDLGSSSSAETSPKKVKSLNKILTPKQKRKLHQERYRTYTVAAEMVVSVQNSLSEENFSEYQSVAESNMSVYSDAKGSVSSKTTPKERRKNDVARFQTQVIDQSVTSALLQLSKEGEKNEVSYKSAATNSEKSSSELKPASRSKLSIRRNVMQKRIENKDRFKTQTISEGSLSPDVSVNLPTSTANSNSDLQNLVEQEAGRVLKKLKESKLHPDELLDCETLSLVSNDDDSEHNSGSSINYRTYTKNCRLKNPSESTNISKLANTKNEITSCSDENVSTDESLNFIKPKIVKPEERPSSVELNNCENKGIRGRRKPLYAKSNVPARNVNSRPMRNITSNLVKNVTSVIKSNTGLKKIPTKLNKTPIVKAPVQNKFIRPPSGHQFSKVSKVGGVTTKTTSTESAKEKVETTKPPPLERQGTFTKEDQATIAPKSRIPTSNIPAPKSRIARAISQTNSTVGKTVAKVQSVMSSRSTKITKSISSDRASNLKSTSNGGSTISRSSSADSRDSSNRLNNSSSNQSLKSETRNGTTSKRSSLSNISQRSNSNSSLVSNGSTSKKQVTSKIASLWKKVEEQQKLPTKKDTRVWIQREKEVLEPESPRLLRSDTFDKKNGVTLRNKAESSTKRISRSGSFIVMDDGESETIECNSQAQIIDADDDLEF